MAQIEIAKAFGVATLVLVFTLAASYPMVAFYATFIDPGHGQDFYAEAAFRIAPWSSYIFGPIVFFCCVYYLSKSGKISKPLHFAVCAFSIYVLGDLVFIPMLLGIPVSAMATIGTMLSLCTKFIAALLGAQLSLSSIGTP